jgi:hypothetical protein
MVAQLKFNLKPSIGEPSFINGFNSVNLSGVKPKLAPPPSAYFNYRGTTEQKLNKSQQSSKSKRLEVKSRTKQKLASLLAQLGEVELADRLKLCSRKFATITCGSHIVGRQPLHRCDFRLCPFCANRRSRRIIKKYVPAATAFLRTGGKFTPVHLVLTQAHRHGETLAASRKRLLDSFKKLQKRRFWLNHFAGGLYAVEFTLDADGAWHSHLHILAFRRRFFDISILRAEWLKITGDSHVLRLDRIADVSSGLREVVKYISKPLDIERFDKSHVAQFLKLKNARMFGAFGEFAKFCRTFEPSDNGETGGDFETTGFCEGEACPVCAKPLFELILTVKELIGFTRRIEAVPRL